jgi:hypothetical protein
MRLIHCRSYKLQEFPDNSIPKYAILSHTWGDGEVEYHHMGVAPKFGKDRPGWKKIECCCKEALKSDLEYVWIDTCAINKGSSAELSEAINSMYTWYQRAEKCFAYLADVKDKSSADEFRGSRWWTRGWTLQELIAPSEVWFYTKDWALIGTKTDMAAQISEVSGIDEGILAGRRDVETASIAKRMSWASRRKTTRTEDMAYCLMGIFDVNMPMLYGEGKKAFIRLQEEIIKSSDDETIYAWRDLDAAPSSLRGLFATSPECFAKSGSVVPYTDWDLHNPAITTPTGLKITMGLNHYKDNDYYATFFCRSSSDQSTYLGIWLKRLGTGKHQFARFNAQAICNLESRGSLGEVYVRQKQYNLRQEDEAQVNQAVHFRRLDSGGEKYRCCGASLTKQELSLMPVPTIGCSWLPNTSARSFMIPHSFKGPLALLHFDEHAPSTNQFWLSLGVGQNRQLEFSVEYEVPGQSRKMAKPLRPGGSCMVFEDNVEVNMQLETYFDVSFWIIDIIIRPNAWPKSKPKPSKSPFKSLFSQL